jgi:RHH-type rel operon transcriptional repressor/antitoxin RelB
MLAIRLPIEIENRLNTLAQATGKTKTFYAKEAILKYLDDLEVIYLAEKQLIEIKSKTHNSEYVENRNDGEKSWFAKLNLVKMLRKI